MYYNLRYVACRSRWHEHISPNLTELMSFTNSIIIIIKMLDVLSCKILMIEAGGFHHRSGRRRAYAYLYVVAFCFCFWTGLLAEILRICNVKISLGISITDQYITLFFCLLKLISTINLSWDLRSPLPAEDENENHYQTTWEWKWRNDNDNSQQPIQSYLCLWISLVPSSNNMLIWS